MKNTILKAIWKYKIHDFPKVTGTPTIEKVASYENPDFFCFFLTFNSKNVYTGEEFNQINVPFSTFADAIRLLQLRFNNRIKLVDSTTPDEQIINTLPEQCQKYLYESKKEYKELKENTDLETKEVIQAATIAIYNYLKCLEDCGYIHEVERYSLLSYLTDNDL